GVDHLRVRAGADAPGYHHAVKAIVNRREVYLPGRERKLRNIHNPLLVGRISGVVAVDDVGLRGADFTSVGCVLATLAALCDETVFSHEAANDLFRNGDAVSPENGMNSPVSVAAFGLSEHNANPFTDGGKLVWGCHRRLLIKVAALGQAQASQQVP